jgi:hypothetical protein
VNGTIQANGQWYYQQYGQAAGGSGGSVKITATTVSGTGRIEAIGGVSGELPGGAGAGGGGRIAIDYTAMTLSSDNIIACGGNIGSVKGSAGTIYLKDNAEPYGDLIVDNEDRESSVYTPLRTTLSTFHSITIANRGKLQPIAADVDSFSVQQPVSLVNNAMLWLGNGVS